MGSMRGIAGILTVAVATGCAGPTLLPRCTVAAPILVTTGAVGLFVAAGAEYAHANDPTNGANAGYDKLGAAGILVLGIAMSAGAIMAWGKWSECDGGTDTLDRLTREAHERALAQDCLAVARIGARVKNLDAAYYDTTFSADVAISLCR